MGASDIKFILTFAAGMAGFWLSGHLPAYLPARFLPHNRMGLYVLGLILALAIYGLGMFLWAWLMLARRRAAVKPALIAAVLVAVLALATSLVLTNTGLSAVHTNTQLAVLAFCLYLVYGAYYVAGWLLAARLARPRSSAGSN